MRRERNRGSAIAFGAVLALVLGLLGVAFVFISMYMGAGHETKNAVDAGALNVGKQVLDKVTVDLTGPKEMFFSDVVDQNKVSLRNINRVWAKALLVAINTDGATLHGNAGPTAAISVQETWSAAKDISDRLSDELTKASNLHQPFLDYAQKNNVRMLGNGAMVSVLSGPKWQTSLMERDAESNILINTATQLPPDYNLNGSYFTPCTRSSPPPEAANKTFLRGYRPIHVAGHDFWQIPFQYFEKSHLVAGSDFVSNKQPPNMLPAAWSKAVPNAFSVAGIAEKPGSLPEEAMSWVLANPHQTFPLQMPHGFIRIVLEQNTVKFKAVGITIENDTYKFANDDPGTAKIPVWVDVFVQGTAHVGREYILPSLYAAIVGPPGYESNGKAISYLEQRCREMLPEGNFDVAAALSNCVIEEADGEQVFYMYVENDQLVVKPASTANPPGCNIAQAPEGDVGEDLITWEDQGMVNSGTVDFYIWLLFWINITGILPDELHSASVDTSIERTWKPGTGYQEGFQGGCLGELRIHHKADWHVP